MHSLVVLYEMNVLSLISQRLDNYYQIQTKCYSSLYGASRVAGGTAYVSHGPKDHYNVLNVGMEWGIIIQQKWYVV